MKNVIAGRPVAGAALRPVLGSVLGSVLLGLAAMGAAEAAGGGLAGLGGSWSGSGHVHMENGQREAIRCSASYAPRAGGTAVGLSLRCASPSGRIELRASLQASGTRVSGTWEERSYNATGDLSGVAADNSLRLRFSGSLSGAMLVTTNGASQSISVQTDVSALKGVNVSLRRR
jgi:hypothetical protein